MATPFQRQSYILEFVTCGLEIELIVNGRHENKRKASKAVLLALWMTEKLHLSITRKSWANIEDTLSAYGFTLAPSYAEKRGVYLHSFYTVTHDTGFEVEDWPTMRSVDSLEQD